MFLLSGNVLLAEVGWPWSAGKGQPLLCASNREAGGKLQGKTGTPLL